MNRIQIKQYSEYKESEIIQLYRSVGWSNYAQNPDMLRLAYMHSLLVLGAYLGDRLVGIIRIVGDGHSIIYVQDIIVQPEYQREGIGSILLGEIMKRYADVYQKVLLTENQPKTVSFYKNMGFTPADRFDCVAFVNFTV